jgi:hypothetical protein
MAVPMQDLSLRPSLLHFGRQRSSSSSAGRATTLNDERSKFAIVAA